MTAAGLVGQTALVTGGARGIGEAICEHLASLGAHVVVVDLDGEGADAVAARIRASGLLATSRAIDLRDVGAIRGMVDAAWAINERLDILVNNAGIALPAPLLEATLEQWEMQVAVNLRTPFFALQAAARHMIAAGSGKIVNLASTSSFVSSSTPAAIYDLTKGGIRQLTTSAAVELSPHGINVNAVAPGTIGTALTHAVLDTPEKMARSTARIPCGRLGEPADIAAAVAFLASDGAAYMHGHTLVVDGGWLAI